MARLPGFMPTFPAEELASSFAALGMTGAPVANRGAIATAKSGRTGGHPR